MHIDAGQVTVDRDVATVTHHDNHRTTKTEDATHLSIKNAASLSTVLTLDIDAFIVKCHIMQTLHVILTEMANNTVNTSDRHRQTTTVALKVAADTDIL